MIANPDETGGRSQGAAPGAAGWLGLAAAPTFALMALLTLAAGGASDMMCSAARGVPPLSGMGFMYALMSAFHSAPWLNLMYRRRGFAGRQSQMGLRRSR